MVPEKFHLSSAKVWYNNATTENFLASQEAHQQLVTGYIKAYLPHDFALQETIVGIVCHAKRKSNNHGQYLKAPNTLEHRAQQGDYTSLRCTKRSLAIVKDCS